MLNYCYSLNYSGFNCALMEGFFLLNNQYFPVIEDAAIYRQLDFSPQLPNPNMLSFVLLNMIEQPDHIEHTQKVRCGDVKEVAI